MFRRFLIHDLNHSTLLVDISAIGLPTKILPPGMDQKVPYLRFQSWRDAERYLLALGCKPERLNTAKSDLAKTSTAVVTIPKEY